MAQNVQDLLRTRIGEIRRARGWSQAEFAERANRRGVEWTQRTVSFIENGERALNVEEFLLLPTILSSPQAPIGYGDLFAAAEDRPIRVGSVDVDADALSDALSGQPARLVAAVTNAAHEATRERVRALTAVLDEALSDERDIDPDTLADLQKTLERLSESLAEGSDGSVPF